MAPRRIVAFESDAGVGTEIAAGARLIVDVEFGRGCKLFGPTSIEMIGNTAYVVTLTCSGLAALRARSGQHRKGFALAAPQ